MVFVIREGDPTTTGGKVVKGSTNTTIEYKCQNLHRTTGVNRGRHRD